MIVLDNDKLQIEKLEIEIENTAHITNTYIVKEKSSKQALVIDPAFDEKLIKEYIAGYNLDKVVITHTHADHIAALAKLVEDTDAKVYVHVLDYDGLYNGKLSEEETVGTKALPVDKNKVITIEDKDIITLGDVNFEVFHTPGHTKGSIVLYNKENNILFAGDTIFERSYGRTDLVTGSREDMKKSLDKLFGILDDVIVFSGHGEDFNLQSAKRRIRLLFAYKG